MSLRKEELFAVVDALTVVHSEWVAAQNRPHPDAIYWDAVDEVLEAFSLGDIPQECRDLANAVVLLKDAAEEFGERADIGRQYPDDKFWRARQATEDARKQTQAVQVKRYIEPMQELHAQGVSHEQIARMYGFKDDLGRGRPEIVKQELAQPGSVIGPDWVHPEDRRQLELEQASRSRLERTQQRKGLQALRAAQPCPETPRQLWEQKVSTEQSSRMLKLPLEEVEKLFKGFDAEAAKSGQVQPEEVIARMTAEGKKAGEIAQLLGEGWNAKRVSDVQRELKAAA